MPVTSELGSVRQADPWGLLAILPSLFSKFQTIDRQTLLQIVRWMIFEK